ncbi:hypothetical protein QBC37DRAFT_16385 [Rhypophila decipiens]|uniref:Uncharacterized protein n=1 Tax=Rhypophila decipiens TaxID=261697 RepID=A0AAN7B9X5_9PEZI|nr:hypothetical protein QBC37DRAFT_16385 [Rhypophila decipiens]
MASFLDNAANWSLHSVPVAFLLCMLPHAYAIKTAGDKYDVNLPARTIELLSSDKTFDKVKLNRFRRAKAASANGFETLALYAGGIVAANAAGVATPTLNKLALSYLISRGLFNYIYVFLQDNKKFAPVRTLVWMMGIGIIFGLYISAGNAFSQA